MAPLRVSIAHTLLPPRPRAVPIWTIILIFTLALGLFLSLTGTMALRAYSTVAVGLGLLINPATAAVDGGWYAPTGSKVNNLTEALHGTGTYGFIFNSSHTPDDQYGVYNWCNMPHVRKQEYIKPGDEFKLQYVEVVSVNGSRTRLDREGMRWMTS
jgi:acid phosphatase